MPCSEDRHQLLGSWRDTVTCATCHTVLDRLDALCSAGPDGAAWYCRDGEACRERRAAVATTERTEP